jgi:hypothetical protein
VAAVPTTPFGHRSRLAVATTTTTAATAALSTAPTSASRPPYRMTPAEAQSRELKHSEPLQGAPD